MKGSFPCNITPNWTLFLDRDGVINKRIIDGYVTDYSEFIFNNGTLESIAFFASFFNKIIIVTNQQGIGKGIMTEDDLYLVHLKMLNDIENSGGRIDAIYYCPQLKNIPDNYRKPSPEMAYMAARNFSDIDLSNSIMVGDSASDMEFGSNAGMKTVFISNQSSSVKADLIVEDLPAFVTLIKKYCL